MRATHTQHAGCAGAGTGSGIGTCTAWARLEAQPPPALAMVIPMSMEVCSCKCARGSLHRTARPRTAGKAPFVWGHALGQLLSKGHTKGLAVLLSEGHTKRIAVLLSKGHTKGLAVLLSEGHTKRLAVLLSEGHTKRLAVLLSKGHTKRLAVLLSEGHTKWLAVPSCVWAAAGARGPGLPSEGAATGRLAGAQRALPPAPSRPQVLWGPPSLHRWRPPPACTACWRHPAGGRAVLRTSQGHVTVQGKLLLLLCCWAPCTLRFWSWM